MNILIDIDKVNENSKLVKIDNKNSTSSLSIMKEAYGEYIEPQDHIEFANMSQSPEDEQKVIHSLVKI